MKLLMYFYKKAHPPPLPPLRKGRGAMSPSCTRSLASLSFLLKNVNKRLECTKQN